LKKVALKYCGGCDSNFDRVAYAEKIKKELTGSVNWVTIDEPPFDMVLLISGCQVACPEELLRTKITVPLLSISNDSVSPEIIAKKILNER